MIITLYEYLNLKELGIELSENYEPGKDDITYLVETAKKIPRTPEEIEDFSASYLASICLVASQRCTELLTRSTIWSGYRKVDLDSTYGSLVDVSEKPATLAKEVSKSNENYKTHARQYEKGKAYVVFYTGLLSHFEKGHYWAKSKEISNNQENKSAGYETHNASDGVFGGEQTKEVGNGGSYSSEKHRQKQPVEDVTY